VSGKRPSHLYLYGLLGLCTLIWSINYIASKIALRELPPLVVAGVRTALAGILILPVYFWFRSRRSQPDWTRRDIPILLVLGLFGVILNQVFFVVGVGRTSVAHAAIMIGLTPLLVLAMATIVGQEKLSAGRLVGMATALGGVLVLQLAPSSGKARPTLIGDLLVFLAALTFSAFTVLNKRLSRSFTAVTVNTFAFAGGGLALLPLTGWQASGVALDRVSPTAWASVVFMAAFPSVLAYVTYSHVLQYVPASRVSAFSYLQPVIATMLAIPALDEHPTPSLVIGGALVLLGVFLTERL
jgi:drug/metabolite transporter (DMT)-like permease